MESDKLFKYRGYKFYRKTDKNEYEIARLIDYDNDIVSIKIDNEISNMNLSEFRKEYTPLEPFGCISFSKVGMYDIESDENIYDVIISLHKLLDIKMGDNIPYAVCRQNITDFFYNIITDDTTKTLAGVSVSRSTCPTNIPYEIMTSCSTVEHSELVNFYINDTIYDVLECIKDISIYDKTLENSYIEHMKALNPLFEISDKSPVSHEGWCKNLLQLLIENNFITDMDLARDITAVKFDLHGHINDDYILDEDIVVFLSQTFRLNITKALAFKYDHDLDMSEFNKMSYIKMRDHSNNLYIIVYTVGGEYFENDVSVSNPDFAEQYKLAIFDKYKM